MRYLVAQPWREAARWHAEGWWRDETLPGILRSWALSRPDATAIVEAGRRVTWAQLAGAMERLANELTARGFGQGDAAIVRLPDSAAFVACQLAVHAVGGVSVPLVHSTGEVEVEGITQRIGARVDFNSPDFDLNSAALWLPDPVQPAVRPAPDADAVADIMFTSGTTGKPKGAMNSANTKLSGLRGFLSELQPGPDEVWGVLISMAHNAGWLYSYLPSLLTGATSVVVRRGDPEAMLDTLEREAVTATFLVPTHAFDLVNTWRAHPGRWQLKLRYVLTGAASSPPGLIESLHEEWGATVISLYGLTECQANLFTRPSDPIAVAAGSVGRACPGAEVALRSPANGSFVEGAGVGEVVTRGPLVFLGYFDDQAATAAAISADGWLRTGDLGEWTDGNIKIVGRIKEVILRGGGTIVPGDVERGLDGADGVGEVAVVGVPDPRLGEAICACITGTSSLEQLRAHLAAKGVGKSLWPDFVVHFESLPRTSSVGKIRRNVLATEAAQRLAART